VDIESVLSFAASNHRAIMATTRADGRPQLSPVTAGVDDSGHLVVSTRETAAKVRNLEREPYASLCILNDGFFGEWVQVEGPVEIVRLPDAMELLVDYYRRISGEHPDWEDYRAAMERDRRVVVLLTPERAGPTFAG
jgi:PPOX class probable F420-dependent enzyme